MFTTDTDLLRLEPLLFRDLYWLGQRLSRGFATISGSTLTAIGLDVPFDQTPIGAGHVCTVEGVSYEVIERTSATTLAISRVRASDADPVITPSPVTSKPLHVAAFGPQRAIAHAQLLRQFGIEPDLPAQIGEPTADSIMNPGALVRLEALASLAMIFSAGGSLTPQVAELSARAERYASLYRREREGAAAILDLDGDGFPDAVRRARVIPLIRA